MSDAEHPDSEASTADQDTRWWSSTRGAPRFLPLLREAAAVLLAILVAFGLDAWWDGITERRQLMGQLEAVRLELDAALEEVDRTVLPAYLGQMERFLLLRPERIAALPPDTAERAIRQLGIWTFDTSTSATRSLASSALLAELAPGLVSHLLAIPRLVDDLAEDATRVEEWRRQCAARLTELGLYRSMWLIARGRGDESDLDPYAILSAQVGDAEYRSCVAVLYDQREDYTREVEDIRAAVLSARTALSELR